MRIAALVLGQKGYETARAIASAADVNPVCVIAAQDKQLERDYAGETVHLCHQKGIRCLPREKMSAADLEADIVIAAGWRWLVKDLPPGRLIVIHDSLLPRYRGFAPLVNALLNKEPWVGATALWASDDYDQGPILLQKRLAVSYPTTIALEMERMAQLYGELVTELLAGLASGSLSAEGSVQDEAQASYSLWRDDDDFRIDWNASAEEICHFVRCVSSPYRGASTRVKDRLYRVLACESVPDLRIENRTPGKVLLVRNGLPVIVCGRGLIQLNDLRTDAGQTALPLAQFRTRFE